MTTVTESQVSEGIVLLDQGTYLLTDPFAEYEFWTNALDVEVTYYNDLYSSFAALTRIGVYTDGVYYKSLAPSSDGSTVTDVKLVPVPNPGFQRVSFVNGPQSGIGVAASKGSFVTALTFTGGTSTTQIAEKTTDRLMFYGDSIAVGQGSDTPMETSWMMQCRRANHPYVASCDARGFRTLHDDINTGALQTAFVNNVVSRNPGTLWMAVGLNDYDLERWSAADFGTAYGGLLDALNTALPSLAIYCQSPITKTDETANSFGDTLGDYRSAISTAVSTRTGFATYIDGSAILTTSELTDGKHPDQDGHDLIFGEISTQLGITIPAVPEPEFTMANTNYMWKGAVEPAEAGSGGNEIKLWKGAVEPAASTARSPGLNSMQIQYRNFGTSRTRSGLR